MFWELAADTWADEERAAINRVLDSGRYTIGPEIAAFEKAFAAYHGKRHAVMVNSGSSANLVAVASLFHKKTGPFNPAMRSLCRRFPGPPPIIHFNSTG